MSTEPRVIYAGGMTRDLALCTDEGEWRGWLFCRHPDGQWVSLVNIAAEIDVRKEVRQLNAALQRLSAERRAEREHWKGSVARLTAELAEARVEIGELCHEQAEADLHHQEHHAREARAATAIPLEDAVLAMVDARGMPVSGHPGDPIQPVIAAINASLSALAERERKEADHG